MKLKSALTLAAIVFGSLGIQLALAGAAHAACEATAKFDGSTKAWATRQFEAASYRDVRNLKKGCDNFWHAVATRNGSAVNLSLSPAGTITVEGN